MNGYVAFLDLLGFSRLVAREGFKHTAGRYLDLVREAIGRRQPAPEFAVASDSTILTTTGTELNHLNVLLRAIAEIVFRSLMELDLPIRGGITVGHYERIEAGDGGVLVAGRGVVSAYEHEQRQDWVGVSMAPDLVERQPQLQAFFAMGPFGNGEADERRRQGHAGWTLLATRYPAIPLHDSPELDGYVIVPRFRDVTARDLVLRELLDYHGKLNELKPRAPDARAQGKYQDAANFIWQVKGEFERFSANKISWEQFTRGL